MRRQLLFLAGLIALWVLPTARGETVLHEDLAATKLPHGEILLPLPGSQEAGHGMILRLSDGGLSALPALEPGQTGRDLLQKMQTHKLGDLLYPASATFIVVAGQATDLGAGYLYERAADELKEPMRILAHPQSPKSLPGTLANLVEGHVYLINTTDGKYALVRLLRQQGNGAVVQYVYQPDGTLKFDIPKGETPPLPAPGTTAGTPSSATPTTPTTPAAPPSTPSPAASGASPTPTAPGLPANRVAMATTLPAAPQVPVTLTPQPSGNIVLEPFVETLLAQRQKLIQRRLEIIKSPARTDAEIEKKAQAMEELGLLDAEEATDLLIQEIAFYNARARPQQFSMEAFHPAVAALRQIGKPASVAAVKAISTLPIEPAVAGEDPLHTTGYRLRLLAMVIRGIEGPEVGEFMLTHAAAQADTAHRDLYDQAVQYVHQP